MATGKLDFRYGDMERRPGDPIQAEDWNKAMRAIASLAEAGGAPAAVQGSEFDWVRSSPIDPVRASAGGVMIGAGLRAVAIDGTCAYVACSGFQVFELAGLISPAPASARGRVECPDAEDIFLAGGHAYVAAGSAGLAIVNIADPASPRVETVFPLAGSPRRVCVVGNIAYVVSYEQGLEIIDVADRRNPALLSRIFVELPNALVVRDGCAFVASDDSGFCIIDVANPASPAYHSRYSDAFETGKDICLHGNLAYIFDEPNQLLRIIDVSQPAAPRNVGALPIEPYSRVTRMIAHGDSLLVANGIGSPGLYVYDISTPESPDRVAAAGSSAWGMAAGERYVYLATETGSLEVFDLRPPKLALPAGSLGIGAADPQARLEVRGGLTVLEQEPWQAAVLSERYQEFGQGYTPVQYFRDSLGIVHLRGTFRPSPPALTVEAGVVFILPANYRPEFIENHLASAGSAIGKVEIFPDGNVFLSSDSHTSVSLDGINFRAFG